MGFFDTLWHLLNFFAPAVGIGTLAASMAKLLWRHRLDNVAWSSLSLWATGVATLALVAGLLAFGHDGRVWTYALMVVGSALGLWWAGFERRR